MSVLSFPDRLQNPHIQKSSKRLFESFGRLHGSRYSLKPRHLQQTLEDSCEEEMMSDTVSTTQSSVAEDNIFIGLQRTRVEGYITRNESTDRSTHKSTGSNAAKASHTSNIPDTGYQPLVQLPKYKRNYTAVHDYSKLLPSNQSLAQEYAIYGVGAQVCQRNAYIAKSRGYFDTRDAWNLAELILCKDIPLELSLDRVGREPMLIVSPRQRKHLVDAAHTQNELFGRVKWGGHPCGGHWLVGELFVPFDALVV